MAKRIMFFTCFITLFLLLPATVWADDPPGAKLFATYCGACHGTNGQGGFATAIGTEAYLKAHGDDELTQVIAEGTSKGMPAWGKAKGGTLTDDQIDQIVGYLRSLVAPAAVATQSVPAAQTSPAAVQVFIQTKLGLAQAMDAQGQVVLNATLTEYTGYPVIGAKVTFVRKTMFGDLELGSAKTNNAGNASFAISDVPENAEVVASFAGDKNWNPSQTQIEFQPPAVASNYSPSSKLIRLSVDEPLLPPEGSLITPNPPLLPTTLFLLVVAGIWSMYGYVLYQVISIWRRRGKASGPNTLRFGK